MLNATEIWDLYADKAFDAAYGLTAWYPLDTNPDDYSGNDHHANLAMATPTANRFEVEGKAMRFDGKNDEMSRGLVVYHKTKPEYATISDPLNSRLVWGRDVTLSFAVGAQHGRNWYGNVGA